VFNSLIYTAFVPATTTQITITTVSSATLTPTGVINYVADAPTLVLLYNST